MLRFTKMNGAGNDFVLIDNRLGNINLKRNLIARLANKVAGAKGKISFETPAGVISADLTGDLVTLQMTEPTDLRLNVPLRVADENKNIHFINSGVPHAVIPVGQVDDVNVR